MRALTFTPPASGKGQPSVKVVDVPKPKPGAGEVLVRVQYAGLQYADYEAWHGEKNKFIAKALKTSPVVSGIEMAGIAETDGTRIKRGDKVFGYTNIFKGPFYHAEYVVINEDKIAVIPDTVTLRGATSIVGGGLTAIAALERIAKLKPKESVLITGATGSVGTTALQLAKYIGAEVTGICHSSQRELALELGASDVLAYDRGELPRPGNQFDVVFDAAAALSFTRAGKFLKPKGRYVTTMPHLDVGGFLKSLLSPRKWGFLLVSDTDAEKMARLQRLMSEGVFQETVDKVFPVASAREALDYQQGTGKRGKILLDFTV